MHVLSFFSRIFVTCTVHLFVQIQTSWSYCRSDQCLHPVWFQRSSDDVIHQGILQSKANNQI